MPVNKFENFIESLMQTAPVMGPVERKDQPGFYLFDWLENPEDFIPAYTGTTLPPKKAFFPPDQVLFDFTADTPPKIVPRQQTFSFFLMGVHPCDLAALAALDMAYLEPPAEMLWAENRKRAVIIGMDCMPDEYCFCTSTNTCHARKPCDLFFTRTADNYVVEVYSQKGRSLINQFALKKAADDDCLARDRHQYRKENAVCAHFHADVAELADILEREGLQETWKEIAGRCYSCGSCNTTCPTCFCFNMHDAFDVNLQSGHRHRTWDSCQLPEFAVIAGGENMRKERWQRVRHRWHRKFDYLYRQFGMPYCTGCGRCSRACTADINIVDTTNQLIASARKTASDKGPCC